MSRLSQKHKLKTPDILGKVTHWLKAQFKAKPDSTYMFTHIYQKQ